MYVHEMYHEFYEKEGHGFKPSREAELYQLEVLRHILDVSGLTKKRYNKLSLTKKGEVILTKEKHNQLYQLLFTSYCSQLNWAFMDRFDELRLIQASAVFYIYMLHRMAGNNYINEEQLGGAYFEAFPALAHEVRPCSYSTPEETISRTFRIRFLNRMCEPFGLLESKQGPGMSINSKDYRVTEFFKENFIFFNEK